MFIAKNTLTNFFWGNVGFAAVLWRLRQRVSCSNCDVSIWVKILEWDDKPLTNKQKIFDMLFRIYLVGNCIMKLNKFPWNYDLFCRFSSHELKAQVTFSDRLSSDCLSVIFSHFHLLLQNHWANINQTWHITSLGKGNFILVKWKATPFSKER